MNITIINKGNRNQLVCKRTDGSTEISDLGPVLPFHDIAHFVVETELELTSGFYGNINAGYTVSQLSDKEIIKKLPVEALVPEIITRALQSLYADACSLSSFMELIEAEFAVYNIHYPITLNEDKIKLLLDSYKSLLTQWNQLKEGESLKLEFHQ